MHGIRNIILYSCTLAGILVMYIFSGLWGLQMAFLQPAASPIWPPTAIALTTLLFFGYRVCPAIFAGALITGGLTTGWDAAGMLLIATGNTLEGVVGCYLLRRFAGGINTFQSPWSIVVYILCAVFISTAISAAFGLESIYLSHQFSFDQLKDAGITWWMGNITSNLIFTPFLILWLQKNNRVIGNALEFYMLIVLVIGMSWYVFADISGMFHFQYVVIPLLLWAAFRFGLRGASWVTIVVFCISTYGTLQSLGPYTSGDRNLVLLSLQMYLGALSMTGLFFASIIEKNAREKKFSDALLDSLGEGMIAIDENKKISAVNNKALLLLHTTKQSLLGRDFFEAARLQYEDGSRVPQENYPTLIAFQTGKTISNDTLYEIRDDASRFPVHIVATPVVVGGIAVGALELFYDISHEKEIDRTKSEFISIASHQLRTPLTILSWYADALLSKKRNRVDTEDSRCLQEIKMAAVRMSTLVNSLLNVSHIELSAFPVEPVTIDTQNIIGLILNELASAIKKKKINVNVSIDPAMRTFSADANLLHMILYNVIANSVEYTLKEKIVFIKALRRGDESCFTISDEGIGIPKEAQPRIFTKFFRADNAKEHHPDGTGLGLYIVKSILDAVGGTISFVSQENKGTTFTITLPPGGMKQRGGTKELIPSR